MDSWLINNCYFVFQFIYFCLFAPRNSNVLFLFFLLLFLLFNLRVQYWDQEFKRPILYASWPVRCQVFCALLIIADSMIFNRSGYELLPRTFHLLLWIFLHLEKFSVYANLWGPSVSVFKEISVSSNDKGISLQKVKEANCSNSLASKIWFFFLGFYCRAR